MTLLRSVKTALALLSTMSALSSCSTITETARSALLAGGGAAAAHGLSDGDPLITGLGAAAGASASKLLNSQAQERARELYLSGFADGQANVLKREYLQAKRRSGATPQEPPLRRRLIEVTIPKQTRSDGVILDAHKKVIEVID